MRKILALMQFDMTNALRDSMVIYILVAPFLLALGLRLFLPSVEGATVRFAVQVPTEPTRAVVTFGDGETRLAARELAERLANYGTVETFADAGGVRERVGATDDVGGFVVSDDGRWRIVLEGNEDAESGPLMQSVLYDLSRQTRTAEYTVTEAGTRSPFTEYASVALIMLASLIGGLAVSFGMIDEKEQGVTRAFSVTLLTPAGYFAARGILAAVIGYVVATIGHVILVGSSVPMGSFLLALLAAAPLPLLIVLLVGGIAKNQIQALAVLKIVMLIYLTIPFVSIAVPRTWHWLFYVFPNYWMFRTFEDLYVSGARAGDLPLAAVVTLVSGVLALIALGFGLRNQLKPR